MKTPMKVELKIEMRTIAAYHAIKPAVVAANLGYYGVSGLMLTAIIDYTDYPLLIDIVANAARKANIPRDEYVVITVRNIPSTGDPRGRPTNPQSLTLDLPFN